MFAAKRNEMPRIEFNRRIFTITGDDILPYYHVVRLWLAEVGGLHGQAA
ncbi:MAG: hypothetical protein U1F43_26310 [Myxococcota bacterium]